jgi:predicted ATPase/DNA-binding SARP family transcriptional activator
VRFGILGPLEVTDDGRPLRIGGPKLRVLVAALLVEANKVVSAGQLASALWPQTPPAEEVNALQTHISRLRAVIDRPSGTTQRRLTNEGPGYVLRVSEDELDAFAFEAASHRSRQTLDAGSWERATDLADEALGWWRGQALDEFAHEPFAAARAAQLEEQRLLTVECRTDAGLALGRHRELTSDLEEMVAHHPLRERLWCQLILALYRSDRQSEALRAYARIRNLLAEELGINPCAELVRLEQAVLDQDPTLDWHRPRDAEPVVVTQATRGRGTGSTGADDAESVDRPVTILFTDVENSTALWDRDPATMTAALRDHDAILYDVIERHRGRVFGRPGDGFCAVFDRAKDALAAACEAQRSLRTGPPGNHPRLQVRMAVHTGEAELRDGNYFGGPVNRVGRMRDAAHGGQVLVSSSTRELVADDLPPAATLSDIGRWLFAGLSRSERVYQLEHPDLEQGFPPLRSGRADTGRIPRHSTSFVGRHRDCERTLAGLRGSQLVTITGDGGIGKTRLALEVAQRLDVTDYPDGVWFCDVSTADDATGLAEEVASALQLATPPGTDVQAELVRALQRARLLLLIDNSERLRQAVAQLVELILASGSEAKVLATSRAPLRVQGEQVIPLDPLTVPSNGKDEATTAPAVQLLLDRARAAGAPVEEDDPRLVEIVRRLDGMPLAIELAAPRLATMSAAALVTRLDRRSGLLTGPTTAPSRQRTLRATIDWSFELLGEEAQRLFAALSVFRGGWTLDTAELITTAVGLDPDAVAPLMGELAEHSMIRAELPAQEAARYRMLDMMHAYATERLDETGCSAAVAERHALHFIELAERAEPHRRGPLEPAWVSELAVEFDNLRVAYRWAVDSGRPVEALRLVAALADDVMMRERLEIGRWAQQLASLPDVADEPRRAIALAVASNTALVEGRLDDALQLSQAAVDLEQRTSSPSGWIARNTLALLAAAGVAEGNWEDHLEALVQTSQATGDPLPVAVANYERVQVYALTGQPDKGLAAAQATLELGTELANPSILAMGHLAHGITVAPDDPEMATREHHHGIALASSAQNTLLVQQGLRALQELSGRSGDRAAALASLRGTAHRFGQSGNLNEQVQTVMSMLDSLVAMDCLVPVATICGSLSRTPARLTAACRLIDRTVAERMSHADYVTARRAGAAMSLPEMVTFASKLVEELTAEPVVPTEAGVPPDESTDDG